MSDFFMAFPMIDFLMTFGDRFTLLLMASEMNKYAWSGIVMVQVWRK